MIKGGSEDRASVSTTKRPGNLTKLLKSYVVAMVRGTHLYICI